MVEEESQRGGNKLLGISEIKEEEDRHNNSSILQRSADWEKEKNLEVPVN